VRRLGGVTGDVIGAAIEIALATGLVVASALHAAL
jgi:adenosylcobinamide-GDP ribazoletransferase